MGIGEKKCLSYPKESLRMGTEKKWIEYPKEKENGLVTFCWKMKLEKFNKFLCV